MNARLTGLGLNLLSFAVGIGGWYLLTATGAVVLPGPVDVLERAVTLLLNGQLVGIYSPVCVGFSPVSCLAWRSQYR